MIRAQWARGNDKDDIPLARRIGSLRSTYFFNSRFFPLPIFLLLFLIPFYFLISFVFNSLDLRSNGSLSTEKDGKLLGHFPYPEAPLSDLRTLPSGLKVHVDVFEAIKNMQYQASLEGVQLIVISGFRSIETQRLIFYQTKSSRNQIAIERAEVSAPPGYSEHSTGYAIDFGDRYMRETDFEVSFESTPAFRWLKENAAKFHFVLSFPKGNKQGVSYEPWHWRFEGTVEALKSFEPANQMRRR